MHIFVTGGTGFIGRHLLKTLQFEDVDCLTRDKPEIVRKMGARPVIGSLQNIPDLSSYDLVYHLAGILGGYAKKEDYFRTHVEGTRNLVKKLSGQKLIFLSSAGVLGPVVGADESSSYNPTNIYEQTKAQAEMIVRSYPNHAILRPEFVYGPGDRHVLKLFRAIKNRRFYIIGDGKSLLHPTYVQDVIQALNAAKDHKGIFNIAGEKAISVNDFSRLVAGLLDAKNSKKVPKWLAKAYLNITESLRMKSALTRSRYAFFTQSRSVDSGKAKKMLGYRPIALKDGLNETIRWYQDENLI